MLGFIFPILTLINIAWGQENTFYDFSNLTFPCDFIFGAATSAFRVEGAWNVSGKGESIWDRFAHTRPELFADGSNADVACNSYYKFREDVSNVKDIGFSMYRFSFSWSRLLPTGYPESLNPDGVRYYTELIDEMIKKGITPMGTLYHWDLPQPLEDIGGWRNPDMADIFVKYARVVFNLFGDKIKWWITLNEPYLASLGYAGEFPNIFAPNLRLPGIGNYLAGHNLLRAHGKTYRMYDSEFRAAQGGKLSVALNGFFFLQNSDDPEDAARTERANQFTFGYMAQPIFSTEGDYPAIMRQVIDQNSAGEGLSQSRLPYFTQEEINEIRGSFDFFGLSHLTSKLAAPSNLSTFPNPSYLRDRGVMVSNIPGKQVGDCPMFQIVPEGIRYQLNWIKERYNNPPVFITTNGYCDRGGLQDNNRIFYFREYLRSILSAIYEDGVKVLGYIVWTLMDDFERTLGYSSKFGLLHTDFNSPSRDRSYKSSTYFFRDLLKYQSEKSC